MSRDPFRSGAVRQMGWTRSPVPQGEYDDLNARIHEKHDDQEASLLGVSVLGPAFFAARTHTSAFFFRSQEQAFRDTTDERGRT